MSQPTDLGISPEATQIVVRSKYQIRRSARKYGGTGDPDSPPPPDLGQRAAQYVRMSTEHQQYSTANQRDAIGAYGKAHGLEVVRTYSDEGRSGLDLAGRPGLQALLRDVAGGSADYGVVLVYDISRWGRFQDCDESACYEFLCRRAGIRVEYCAEQFRNDGSPLASVVKSLKRMMAGEYSRELSVKVFDGKCRLTRLGFRQGGVAGYGLRRMVVTAEGERRGVLETGQHKFLKTDRVVLVPGPASEVKVVRWIFEQVARRGKSAAWITASLNRRGVASPGGGPWTHDRVSLMISNEKYIGTAVFNRRSMKLKTPSVANPREQWVRKEGAFQGVVDPDVFREAQEAVARRSARLSNEAALEMLRALYLRAGTLTAALIDAAKGMPPSRFYENRFGSLLRAYALVGYRPQRNYGFMAGHTARHRFLRETRDEVARRFEARGTVVERGMGGVLVIDGGRRLAVGLGRPCPKPEGGHVWVMQLQTKPRPEGVLVARLKPGTLEVLDYFLLWDRCGSIRIGGHHHWRDRERMQSPELDMVLDQFVAGRPRQRGRGCAPSRPTPPRRAPKRHKAR